MNGVENFPAFPGLKMSLSHEGIASIAAAGMIDKLPFVREYIFAENERGLGKLFKKAYSAIKDDPAFDETCSEYLRPVGEVGGFVSYPASKVKDEVSFIVFLHGYGGNGAWGIATVRRMFPNALIAAPTTGTECTRFNGKQLARWLRSVEQRFSTLHPNVMFGQTNLVALSRGVFPARRLLNESDYPFQSLTLLSTCPAHPITARRAETLAVTMICGDSDERVDLNASRRYLRKLQQRGFHVRQAIIEDANHFMFLSHTARVSKLLRKLTDFS